MRQFKRTNRTKRTYARKKTKQSGISLSKTFQAGLVPLLVIAVSFAATAVIGFRPTEKEFSLRHLIFPPFSISAVFALSENALNSFVHAIRTGRLPDLTVSFTLPDAQQPLAFPQFYIHEAVQTFIHTIYTIVSGISAVCQFLNPVPLFLYIVTFCFQTGQAVMSVGSLISAPAHAVGALSQAINPFPLLKTVGELLWQLLAEIGNFVLFICTALVHALFILIHIFVSSVLYVFTLLVSGIYFLVTALVHGVNEVILLFWHGIVGTFRFTAGILIFAYHTVAGFVVAVFQFIAWVIAWTSRAIIWVADILFSVINRIIDRLLRLLAVPFIVLGYYWKQISPYIQLLGKHINFSTNELTASISQTFSLLGNLIKSFPHK